VNVNNKCDGCHDTGGWTSNRPASGFNHNLTKFHLVGRHVNLSCGKCHKEGDFRRPVAHDLCRNCHEDPHRGQFASRAGGSDCSACHNPTDFKPALFDREAHMRTAFPLLGKHSALPCAECHQPEGRDTRYKIGKLLCSDCHNEPHGGEFASEPYNNKCDLCHTMEGFESTTFSLERHSRTQFPLTGRHVEVACSNCHKPPISGASKGEQEIANAPLAARGMHGPQNAAGQYHFASRACDVCHTDPHRIRPESNLTCETCHLTRGWKDLRTFDHSRTQFKLDGSHGDPAHPIACIECHRASGQAHGVKAGTTPVFSETSSQCLRCHIEKDPHGGQFNSPGGRQEDCSSCHVSAGWNAGGFNHERARFTLDVAHRKVTCAKCHKEQKNAEGKMIRMYRDTPTDCLKCH
jgi:hypothetical protein